MSETDITTETVKKGIEDGVLYVAENVNLSAESEDILVGLLNHVRDAGAEGISFLDRIIEAIRVRTNQTSKEIEG
jgi:hypothetical protein